MQRGAVKFTSRPEYDSPVALIAGPPAQALVVAWLSDSAARVVLALAAVETKEAIESEVDADSEDSIDAIRAQYKDDKSLYVSTGGFTMDARYEAERASIPTTLMDLDQLVDAKCRQNEQSSEVCY